jgi:hypothetical protein
MRDLSRRAMLCQAAVASGLGGIFAMTASGQQGTPVRVPAGGVPTPAIGGGRGGSAVHYGPINKFSSPSDLKITDIRAIRVAANFDYPIIKIYTNQDVYGLGEVRDAGTENSALSMKPLLVGKSPLDISGILQTVRPFTGPGRQSGGYSAIDIALHDISGKVHRHLRPQEVRGANGGAHEAWLHLLQDGCYHQLLRRQARYFGYRRRSHGQGTGGRR